MKLQVTFPSRLMSALIVFTFFSLTLIHSSLHAQTMEIPFIPNSFPQQNCNNYSGNPVFNWKPTHGSPRGLTNSLKTELAVKDAFPSIKSEGLYLDLQSQLFTLEKDKNYAFTIYYECPDPSNITFKLYALKNAPTEMSDPNCSEKDVPSLTSKQGIYTDASNYLQLSYSGQINTLNFTYTANDNYRYLWLYSDVLANYGSNTRSVVYVTKIQVESLGTSSSGGGTTCAQTPQNRRTHVASGYTARLNWDALENMPNKYEVQYRLTGNTSWTIKNVSSLNDYCWLYDLTPNTSYDWRVRSNCGTSESEWSQVETFTTPGLSDISLTCENLPQTIYLQNLPADMIFNGWVYSDNVEMISSTSSSITIKAKPSPTGGPGWVKAKVKHTELSAGSVTENFDVGLPYGYTQGHIELHPWNGPSERIYYQNWTRLHVDEVGIYYGHTDWEWSAQYSMMQQSTSSNILIKPTTIGYITVKARRNNACGQGPWLTQIFDVTDGDNFESPHGGGW